MIKTKDIEKALTRKKEKKKLSFLSTGSTLLNLACTGHPYHGFAKGKYHIIIGDSTSGKTFLSLTCLAEASTDPKFDDFRFIYDDNEGGAMMDIEKFFGESVFKRMEPPDGDKDVPLFSSTIEEFYFNVDDAIKKGKPFIYVLDSMDSLSSEEEISKFDKTKEALRKGKEVAGAYTDGKAKKNSANLRRLLTPLKKSGSILIIISQTRDSLGFGFEKKNRSGGRALRFYAAIELWSSVKSSITKVIKGKNRQLGTLCSIRVKKNRVTGRDRVVTIPIYHSFGIDDIGSCVDYLSKEEGHWTTSGASITAPEFDFTGNRGKLIRHIENEGLEKDLIDIVTDTWNEIEEACRVKRKKRY